MSTQGVDIFVHDGTAHTQAFARLFNFISGTNSEEQEIPMTAPVTLRLAKYFIIAQVDILRVVPTSSREGASLTHTVVWTRFGGTV